MDKRDKLQLEFANKAHEYLLTNKKGVVDITQRFGKIKFTIELIKLLNPNAKILITYPTNIIKESWVNDFVKFNCEFDVTYCNIESIKKHLDTQWDLWVFDECHKYSDNEALLIMKLIRVCNYTIGLSGTMSKWTKKELENLFGLKVILVYNQQEGINDGIISDYKIQCHLVDLDDTVKTPNSKGKLVTEKKRYDNLTYVINKFKEEGKDTGFMSLNRNRISQNSIAKRNVVLKLIEELKGKRFIVFCGTSKIAESLGIPYYHTKCKNNTLQDFIDNKIDSIALIGIGKEGVTFKNLDTVILSDFTGNEETTSQIVSRAMIPDYEGKVADIKFIVLNEKPELKKLENSIKLLNLKKIEYV